MRMTSRRLQTGVVPLFLIVLIVGVAQGQSVTESSYRALVDDYCVTCHNQEVLDGSEQAASPLVAQLRAVGLALDTLDLAEVSTHPAEWERVVR